MNQKSSHLWMKRSISLLGSLGLVGGSWLSLPSWAQTADEVQETTKVQLQAPKILGATESEHPVPQTTLSPSGKNSYIDNNNYTLASPRPYSPPRQVIVSDRLLGCKTVAENGRLSGGSCGVAVKPRFNKAPFRQALASQRLVALQPNKTYQKPVQPIRRLAAPPQYTSNRLEINGVSLALAPVQRGITNIVKSQENLAPIAKYERATQMGATVTNQPNRTDLLFPLALAAPISSAFGWRTHPITGRQTMHSGTDLAAPLGTPVLAAYPGQVAAADWVGGYGLMVTVRHLEGMQESRYAHLSEIYVQPGEWVEQGAVIGRVGSTGFSTGPHLHFEWRHLTEQGWVAVDAGLHLEYALENLLQSMQLAQQTPEKGS